MVADKEKDDEIESDVAIATTKKRKEAGGSRLAKYSTPKTKGVEEKHMSVKRKMDEVHM